MPTSDDLQKQARSFGDTLNDLLNRTVVNGPVLSVVTSQPGDRAWIGYRLTKNEFVPRQAMPLTASEAKPKLFLGAYYVLTIEDGYLTSQRSNGGVYLDADMGTCMFRYDYERDKSGYPESHLHVYGESPALAALGHPKPLGDLHFPMGGRRFRPSLEDIILMLVTEGLVDARDGWESAISEHRERFHKIQLKAAARRDPETAQAGIDTARSD